MEDVDLQRRLVPHFLGELSRGALLLETLITTESPISYSPPTVRRWETHKRLLPRFCWETAKEASLPCPAHRFLCPGAQVLVGLLSEVCTAMDFTISQ